MIDLKKRNSLFIERSIMGALLFLKESLWADEYASKKGFLQARDPRLKAVSVFVMLLAVLFSKSILWIACLYGACLVLACASSIDIAFFLKRTWLFVPIFSLCIAIPALFNVFSPGDVLVSFKVFVWTLSITKQGLASAGIFFLRVLTSVSWCVLLALTTRHYALLKALRFFKIPQIFVMTIGMCYRYVYLFIEIIQNTYIAIKSRVGFVSSVGGGQGIVAWNIARLWQRSYLLHYQVYDAMISRGFSGEPQAIDGFRATLKDGFVLGIAILTFGLSLWQNHYLN